MLIVQAVSVWRVQIVKKAGFFFFTGSQSPSEESQKECSSEKTLGGLNSKIGLDEKFLGFFFQKVFSTLVDLGKSKHFELFGPHF